MAFFLSFVSFSRRPSTRDTERVSHFRHRVFISRFRLSSLRFHMFRSNKRVLCAAAARVPHIRLRAVTGGQMSDLMPPLSIIYALPIRSYAYVSQICFVSPLAAVRDVRKFFVFLHSASGVNVMLVLFLKISISIIPLFGIIFNVIVQRSCSVNKQRVVVQFQSSVNTKRPMLFILYTLSQTIHVCHLPIIDMNEITVARCMCHVRVQNTRRHTDCRLQSEWSSERAWRR